MLLPGVILAVTVFAGDFTIDRLLGTEWGISLRGVLVIPLIVTVMVSALKVPIRRNVSPVVVKFIYCHCGWLFALYLSAFWSTGNGYQLQYLNDVLWLTVFMVSGFVLATRINAHELNRVTNLLLVICAALFLSALASGPGLGGRYSALGGGPNVFVRFMIIGLLLAILRWVQSRHPVFLLLGAAFIVGAILSGSRGGVVALGATAVLAGFGYVTSLRRLYGYSAILAVLGILLTAVFRYVPAVSEWFNARFIDTLVVGDIYTAGRDSLFDSGLNLFYDNPVIGAGLGTFAASHNGGYPHNLFIETMAASGLLGLIPLIGSLALASGALYRARPLSPTVLIFAMIAFSIFVASQFSGSYIDTRLLWFFLLLALIFRNEYNVNLSVDSDRA